MSGSGGGGGFGGGRSPSLSCANISFNTDINSPQEDTVSSLEVGDIVDLEIRENRLVVVEQQSSQIIGSINWINLIQLMDCIKSGFEYQGKVRDIQGGLVKIHVYNKHSG